jgi:hypothetical protein
MGRYYFHVRAGDELTSDEEGTDLPDFSAAKREALLSARELLAEAIKSGKKTVPDAFVIADEAGQELDSVPLAAALPEPLRRRPPWLARLIYKVHFRIFGPFPPTAHGQH